MGPQQAGRIDDSFWALSSVTHPCNKRRGQSQPDTSTDIRQQQACLFVAAAASTSADAAAAAASTGTGTGAAARSNRQRVAVHKERLYRGREQSDFLQPDLQALHRVVRKQPQRNLMASLRHQHGSDRDPAAGRDHKQRPPESQ